MTTTEKLKRIAAAIKALPAEKAGPLAARNKRLNRTARSIQEQLSALGVEADLLLADCGIARSEPEEASAEPAES